MWLQVMAVSFYISHIPPKLDSTVKTFWQKSNLEIFSQHLKQIYGSENSRYGIQEMAWLDSGWDCVHSAMQWYVQFHYKLHYFN